MRNEIIDRLQKISKGDIPEGYKKTETGIIPIDWEVKQIQELCELVSGQHILADDYNDTGKGIPYLTGPADIINRKISPTKYTEKPKALCMKDDILITVKGSGAGKVVIADSEYCISRQLMAIRPKEPEHKYFYYVFEDMATKYNNESEGLIPGINRNDINEKIIPIPSEAVERKTIATVISTWDKAIELLENLIEQKKLQQQGLMERLLTGKIRIPGFHNGWEKIKLGSVLKERKELDRTDLELLSITGQLGVIRRTEIEGKDNSSEDKSKYKRIAPLDIGYNGSSTLFRTVFIRSVA